MAVYLVRHAHAKSRRRWDEADAARPLSERGHRRAEVIAARLGAVGVTHVASSPAVRCLQTVGPLAQHLSLDIETDPRLVEGAPVAPALDHLLDTLDSGANVVMCSHGDVIPEIIAALDRRGMILHGPSGFEKGSIWAIERDSTHRLHGHYDPA